MIRYISLTALGLLAMLLTPLGVPSAGGAFADPDAVEWTSTVIKVAGGISASDLCAELDSTCATLHERRKKGVILLLERTKRTQPAVLKELRSLESQGLAANIEVKWLTNSISVDLAASEMAAVASRPDVVEVFREPELQQMEPVHRKPALSRALSYPGGAEDNLRFIGADSAWKMGYTGEGRLVCHFDASGIDGNHPALYGSWKGLDGDSAAAWCGRPGTGEFPTASGDHGTLVTGVMVGHDDVTGDTIGVAPGAEWIGGVWDPWEWSANPDGDPNTTDDVPDVINISFLTAHICSDTYWDEIDMVEALGTVVVIAAGNRGGYGSMSVVSPASRAVDSLTNFAVGSVHHLDGLVSAFSGRGPSNCDSVSIKPNVMAPGGWIRTSTLDGQYAYTGGTSVSAPHVAGVVAILRQYAPNATAREIKQALLAGCTPAGSPIPNNDYGWGIINIPASIAFLSAEPRANLRISSFDYDPVELADTLVGAITIRNRGHSAASVYAVFSETYEGVVVLNNSIGFGDLNTDQIATGGSPLRVIFDDTLLPGNTVPINFDFHTLDGHVYPCSLRVTAGITGEHRFFTHSNEMLQFTVSNFGEFGFGSRSHRPLDYVGFLYGDSQRDWLFSGSLMLATDSLHVSDGFRDAEMEADEDFWVDASDSMVVTVPGALADQETLCRFNDGQAENSIGVNVTQRTLSWASSPDDKYVVLEYVIENVSHRTIEDLLVGLCFDWTFGYPNYDNVCEGGFSWEEDLGYLYRLATYAGVPNGDTVWYRGLAVLSDDGATSHKVLAQPVNPVLHAPSTSEAVKYSAMSSGIADSTLRAGSHETLLHLLTTGPFTLQPGECDTAAFAVIGADSLSEMRATAIRAREKWKGIVNTYAKPDRFWLGSNYPNPFNAQTTINYTLLIPPMSLWRCTTSSDRESRRFSTGSCPPDDGPLVGMPRIMPLESILSAWLSAKRANPGKCCC